MASLTIRKLDEALKAQLRLRAARSGRSVEDEVRFILRDAASDAKQDLAAPELSAPLRQIVRASTGATHRVTLIIGGGIAAYKALDLIRRLKDRRMHVRCVLTRAAQQFVTPLAASALADERCYTDLFDPQSEFDAGHIRLARDCDLIVVAPATADLMAKMANGHADDLASAILLATDRPIMLAPAMNPLMWSNAATRRNVALLAERGAHLVGPNSGAMAEAGEAGVGRMSEPLEIAAAAEQLLDPKVVGPLRNARLLVTAGPTHEPIDPVRYIANRSSGKQGFAIAAAAAAAGAEVKLISGPVDLPDPPGVDVTRVESARDMLAQVQASLPADCADLRRSRRRLARRRCRRAEDQEAGRRDPIADAGGEPRPAGDGRASVRPASAPRRRLRRRNRKPDRQRAIQAQAKRLRLDRRQRRVAGERRDGWRSQHRAHRHPRRRGIVAGDGQGRRRRRAGGAHRRRIDGDAAMSADVVVEVRRLPHGEGLALPAYQTEHAAGLDLLAAVAEAAPLTLAPGQRALVPTGLAIALPPGFEGQVRPRSGLALKHGITVLEFARHHRRGLSWRGQRHPRSITAPTRS